MAQVEFHYKGKITTIECQEDQKINDIFNKFISQSNINENSIIYYYDNQIVSQNDKNLTFNHMVNLLDKPNKKMKIFVKNDSKYDDNSKFDKDNNIIFLGGEIKMKIKIEKDDVGKNIYFLDNTDGEIMVVKNKEDKLEEHHHDFLKELDGTNTEIYIDNKKQNFDKYFKFNKEGEYNILLKFKNLLKDCSFMFYKCSNLANIDLSS
jgi:hypothetical protein